MSSDQSSIEENEIRQNKLVFLLDEVNKTASIIGNDDAGPDIFIPRSIQHQNQEYLVTCIKKCSFKNSKTIITIQVPNDSELKTIEKESFAFSTVEQIFIPFSLIELKEGWCSNTPQLKKVIISPKSKNFIFIDEKMIVGKSNTKSDEYDVIAFTSRNVKEAIIPSFITRISSFAFSETKIESIYIPPHITKICESAFNCCRELKKVEFPLDSELKIIGKKAFSKTSIKSILIPLHVTKICEGSFHYCTHLQKVEFLPDSELKTIEKDAFSKTSIENIAIPSSVTKLEEGWCPSSTKVTRIVLTQSKEVIDDQNALKTDNYHDSSKIDEKMIVQHLMCPVQCYAMVPPMRTPMTIPECGHSICEMCISKLSECPYCHQKITKAVRNILALQLIESINQSQLIPEESNPPPPSANKLIPKIEPFCAFAAKGENYIEEKFYKCNTCNFSGNKGFCEACAQRCHKGHNIYLTSYSNSYCDCPLEYNCKCMPKNESDTSRCTFELTDGIPVDQPMYQFKDCHVLNDHYLCQNCAIRCHHGHNLIYVGTMKNQVCRCCDQCSCQISTRKPICTYVKTGKNYDKQPFYHCYTCGLVDNLGCCSACAHHCHKGHNVEFVRFADQFYCDCGDGCNGIHCKILHNSNSKSDYLTWCPNFSHENKGKLIEQRKYHCLTCGIINSIGICEACAINCHINHLVKYVGIDKFCCSCYMSDNCKMELAPSLHNKRTCCDRKVLNKEDVSACYICYTCDKSGELKICETCALQKHLDHDIHLLGYMKFDCTG